MVCSPTQNSHTKNSNKKSFVDAIFYLRTVWQMRVRNLVGEEKRLESSQRKLGAKRKPRARGGDFSSGQTSNIFLGNYPTDIPLIIFSWKCQSLSKDFSLLCFRSFFLKNICFVFKWLAFSLCYCEYLT